jgi:hypothetical protein
MLNCSHLVSASRITSEKYHTINWHKKYFHLKHKQKELHLPIEIEPNLFGRALKKEDDLTLPFKSQEAINYCTKLYTLGHNSNDHFIQTLTFQMLKTRKYGPI